MYRSIPHSTTGVSPAKLMYNRKIRTKLPELNTNFTAVNDEFIRDRTVLVKNKEKVYGDKKRGASYSDICVGDKVLLKQIKKDKVTTTFEKNPYTVLSKCRNSVVVENDKGRFTHVKKCICAKDNDVTVAESNLESHNVVTIDEIKIKKFENHNAMLT